MFHRGHFLLIVFDLLTAGLVLWFVVSFLTDGATAVSETFSNIYLVMLGYYVGDKEFLRWRKKYHSHGRQGEYFVITWVGLGLIMFLIEEFGGSGAPHVPHYLTFVIGGVVVMYAVTELLKAEAKKHR